LKTILKLTVAGVFLFFVMSAPAALTLYATGGGSPQLSALYTINPATGAATLAWQFAGIHIYAGGLAYDAATDTLFATGALDSDTGTTRLFTINRFTGAWTNFPGMSPTINLSQGGLAINPLTGILYASGGNGFQSSGLFTINKTTGAATLVGQCGPSCCSSPEFGFNVNGLGFRSDGTLFANGFTLSGVPVNGASSLLFTVNIATGPATTVGTHGVNAGSQLKDSGLAFGADGTLYSLGSTSGSLYSVNPATGTATLIGASVINFGVGGGLAFAPGPEPAITGVSLSGTNLVINGSNGLSNRTYQVLASTNIILPRIQWLPVATNILNTNGNFTITATNVVSRSFPQRFFILQLQ
jgi:hypothetical protein